MGIITSIYPKSAVPVAYPLWPFNDIIDPNSIGDVKFQAEELDFPDKCKYFKNAAAGITIPYKDLMLCAGLMLSPAQTTPSFTSWAFLLDHYRTIVKKGDIARYAPHAKSWDARIKAVFSERISCGIAAWSLWNHDKIVHIADVADFLGTTGTGPYSGMSVSAVSTAGKSSDLRPDFFCLTESNECVIVECKGSMGPPSTITADITKGKEQVESIKPTGVTMRKDAAQLVYATNLRCYTDNPKIGCDSTVRVVDPIFKDNAIEIPLNEDQIALKAYGKLLNFMGRPDIYEALLEGQIFPPEDLSNIEISLDNRLGFIPLSAAFGYAFGFRTDVAKTLLCESRQNLAARLAEVRGRWREYSDERNELNSRLSLILPNGFVRFQFD